MATIQEKLASILPEKRKTVTTLRKEYGDRVISEVTVGQAYGGMRGVKGLVCDTSQVSADKGLIIRGIPIKELTDKIPEEILWLLLTGELPSEQELKGLQDEIRKRSTVPSYVWDVLNAMPSDSHPMAMLDTAILVMQKESVFARRYDKGLKKEEYWISTLEDALDIIAKITVIGAGVYRQRFNKGERIEPDTSLDWGGNYAYMLGLPNPNDEFANLIRLYLTLHCDHESGNVSANTTAVVNSALSDLYYSLSAGLNGLAGPLHGLANQMCLKWVLSVIEKFNGVPTEEQLTKFTWDTLNSGNVIPGYGHAVLRVTDPRYEAFLGFGKKYCTGDPIFDTVAKVFEVVPGILGQIKKIKDPWPNVDAGSGSLLYHYGLKEFPYYTVLFSISRALGVTSQAVLARGLGLPITRPKSVTTKWLQETVIK